MHVSGVVLFRNEKSSIVNSYCCLFNHSPEEYWATPKQFSTGEVLRNHCDITERSFFGFFMRRWALISMDKCQSLTSDFTVTAN